MGTSMSPLPNSFLGLIIFLDTEDPGCLIRDLQIVHVNAVLNMALALGLSKLFLCSPQMCSSSTGKHGDYWKICAIWSVVSSLLLIFS